MTRKVISNHRTHNNNISTRVSTYHQPLTMPLTHGSCSHQFRGAPPSSPLSLTVILMIAIAYNSSNDFNMYLLPQCHKITFEKKHFPILESSGSFCERFLSPSWLAFSASYHRTVQYLTIGHPEDTESPEYKSVPMNINVCSRVYTT